MIRISLAGEGFVLYQLPKREVTAVAIAKDGSSYAAAVAERAPDIVRERTSLITRYSNL